MPILQNPSLTLYFLANDLKSGHLSTQTMGPEHIIYGSISFRYQLLNGLKPSSNQVTLLLDKECSSIEDIITTEGDITAVLRDGQSLLFTGYLSHNYSWCITEGGKSALEITLEDVGTRLLGKAFLPSGKHLFTCSASEAIAVLCASAGISVAAQSLVIEQPITKTVESNQSCKSILEQMLYELGYVYYFNEAGELSLFQITCTSTENLPILDKEQLYVVGGKAITVGKKIRQYKSARITYTSLGTASGYLIYRNTTGRGDGHPYCYMKLDPGEHFDGLALYSTAEWEALQEDSFREPSLLEACNAESEITIVGSNDIIAVSHITSEFTAQSGSVTCSITASGGPYLTINVHNQGSLPYYITRMDAYADILYCKDINIVRTGDLEYSSDTSENLLQEELEFVHTKELAQMHANLLGQYHRYANAQYSFYSKRNMELGTIIKLLDNVFSGLEVNVLLTAKSYTDSSELIQYTAVGISAFNLTAEVFSQRISKAKNDTVGAPGEKGADGSSFTVTIESSNGSVFRLEAISTTLNCRVYLNTEEITDTLDASRFCWKRSSSNPSSDESWNTSSKAIGHKSVSITPTDCIGRTVFFCEIDFDQYQA